MEEGLQHTDVGSTEAVDLGHALKLEGDMGRSKTVSGGPTEHGRRLTGRHLTRESFEELYVYVRRCLDVVEARHVVIPTDVGAYAAFEEFEYVGVVHL